MPYRTAAPPTTPRRSLRCALRLCSMQADAERGAFVCAACGRSRSPRGSSERDALHELQHRRAALIDRARWERELLAWIAGGKQGPEPDMAIPGPGKSVLL